MTFRTIFASWVTTYQRNDFTADLVAGVITAILLVPQGIAFAMLAGLPPQAGLYASFLPPIAYALFGSSRTLSVGPVSVAAIMVASALGAHQGDYVGEATILAFESALILLVLAFARAGALVNFISHPVLSGFTAGAALLIVGSQLPNLFGVKAPENFWSAASHLPTLIAQINLSTLLIGLGSIAALLAINKPLARLLTSMRWRGELVTGIAKLGPLVVVAVGTITVVALDLVARQAVGVVGNVPSGLPHMTTHFFSLDAATWWRLLPSAFFITLIGYVESVAIAKVLAARRRESIDANRELFALGAANFAAAFSGTMPVAGGFSRSMVNHAAGARTQAATIITASLIASALAFAAPLFANIPKAALAAIIIVAIVPLIGIGALRGLWHYDRGDAIIMLLTLTGVLLLGIEHGLLFGALASLLAYVWRTGHPHIAVVGRVAGTEHFRNVLRHHVETWPEPILLRVDESLTFANASVVADFVNAELQKHNNDVRHIVLICTAVNAIDSSALEMLESLVETLRANQVTLHFAEIKGPVMDRLQRVNFAETIKPGKIFFRTEDAIVELAKLP